MEERWFLSPGGGGDEKVLLFREAAGDQNPHLRGLGKIPRDQLEKKEKREGIKLHEGTYRGCKNFLERGAKGGN